MLEGNLKTKRKTHFEIANRVVTAIGLENCTDDAARSLINASVLPDSWGDYPHHYGKDGVIRQRVVEARKCWLRGETGGCGYYLGLAFHYIADKWTLMNGSDPRHTRWEQAIAQSSLYNYPDLYRLVQFSDMSDYEKERYFSLLNKIEKDPLGKDATLKVATADRPNNVSTPSLDLNLAYHISLRVGQSVFSSKMPPLEIQEKIKASSDAIDSVLRKTMFKVTWFFLFALSIVGTGLLLAINAVDSIILALALAAILVSDVFTINLFLTKGDAYKKVRALRLAINFWLLMFIASGVIWGYTLSLSTFMSAELFTRVIAVLVSSSLFIQLFLQFTYLNGKPKVHELSTYLDWFNDPKSSRSVIDNSDTVDKKQIMPTNVSLRHCWRCDTLYDTKLADKCPVCQAINR